MLIKFQKNMNLKEGENSIKFVCASSKQFATAKVFLWNHDVKVVVSDIDGTITK
jgi:phosphatidate phosphatase LPIN